MSLFTFFLLGLACPSAYAYVDPGSGMLLIQGFIALLAGGIAFMRSPWRSLKRLWNRLRRRPDA